MRLRTPEHTAPVLDHLEELRGRLLKAALFWGLAAAVTWNWRDTLLELLKRPLYGSELYQKGLLTLAFTSLPEALMMSLSLAAWGGLALALPFILQQVWLFISPGLYEHERRWAVPFMLGAGLSFALGVLFTYFVVLPSMVPFLVDFMGTQVAGVLSIGKYVSQVLTIMVAMGICFELPILSFVLTKIGLVNAPMLASARRVAFVAILIVAAVITPTPDPLNMMLVALPIYALYEVSIIVSRLSAPKPEAQGMPEGQA